MLLLATSLLHRKGIKRSSNKKGSLTPGLFNPQPHSLLSDALRRNLTLLVYCIYAYLVQALC